MIQQDRRTFLKTLTASGALIVTVPMAGLHAAQGEAADNTLGLYVRLEPTGETVIGAPSSEIGQGTWVALSMLIAEELDVDFDDVTIEPQDLLYRREEDRVMPAAFFTGAGGSEAVWQSWAPARQAGAVVRHMLRSAAARHWEVPIEEITTRNGVLSHEPSNRSVPYHAMVALAREEPVPEGDLALKSAADRRIIGRSQTDKFAEKIARGERLYGIDQKYPNMAYAVIARAPRFDAELAEVDDSAALAIPGVLQTVRLQGPGEGGQYGYVPLASGVAVVAESLWSAMKGRDALNVEWTPGPMAETSSSDIAARADTLMEGEGQTIRDDGNFSSAFENAERRLEATYDLPIVAHATLEPMGAIADVRDDGVTVITSTQSPFSVAAVVARNLGIERDQIEVRNIRNGGGFGRRLSVDYASEAVLISQAIGRPVRVHWDRTDDLHHDRYRPLAHARMKVGLDANGAITAWQHRLASTAIRHRGSSAAEEYHVQEYWNDVPPAQLVPNMHVEYHFLETAMPFGTWRAPGHMAQAWAIESFLDELAYAAGADPLEYRLRLLGEPRELPYEQHGGPTYDTGRHANVLRLAAENAGWGEALGDGRGRGIASHFTFGTYVAHVVDVTVADGDFTVDRVVSAVDCGTPVNPNGIRAQNEGGINDALSVMRGQEITVTNGEVDQRNFDTYEMMRIDRAATNIETHIVESTAEPRGMGEPPVPPLAPAVANAIFAATGTRIRRLPVGNQLRS